MSPFYSITTLNCNLHLFPWLQVNGGTKLSNVVDYAVKAVKEKQHRSVLWTGSGSGAISKTVSCAEIMKRSFEMHQITRIKYSLWVSKCRVIPLNNSMLFAYRTEEDWDPQTDGLDPIVVKRYIPTIFIYLTLDEVDSTELGYQSSKTETGMWLDRPKVGDKRPNTQQSNGNRSQEKVPGSSKGNNNHPRRSGGGDKNKGGNKSQGNKPQTKNKAQGSGSAGKSTKIVKIDVPKE